MFTNARTLAAMALSTAAGFFSIASNADAQVYIERVYSIGCDARCYDYAGTITIDCVSYRVSTRCSLLEQIEEALVCRGYDVCRVGRTIRVYSDCDLPDISWNSGQYQLRIRPRHGYYSLSLERCAFDSCDLGYHENGACYRHDSHGSHFNIHLEFGDHDHEIRFGHRDRDHDDHRDHGDRRDNDRRDDHRDNRGRDDWRDGGDGRRDDRRDDDRRDRDHGDNFGERSGGRTYVTPERPLDRPDSAKPAPRIIDPNPGTEHAKPGTGGAKTDDKPVRRGTKLTTPREDDKSSTPGVGAPRADQRDRVIVREPETVKRDDTRKVTNPGNGSRGNERALPKPLPVQSPVAPAPQVKQPAKQPVKEVSKQPAREVQKQPAREAQKQPAKEASKQPASKPAEKKSSGGNSGGDNQKRDRRW